jgi:hypothetical protein
LNQNEANDHTGAPTAAQAFQGYAPPTSSTTYTPNQFFDVVLPRASRGCLRLVAYLIRKTLGWSDEHGNPQNPEATVTYRELIEKAGIGRGRIKEAIEEAVECRFINCLRFGQPHKAGEEGFSALYSLRWDEREDYITDSEDFDGFFAGNGNLTHIPNDFFDFTIPNEPLALVKVVGVIIRHTIGFQTKFGFRRQQVEMSFTEIMRRAGIASRSTMSIAIREALDKNHVCKVSEGFFDPNAGADSQAATYGIKWLEPSQERPRIEPKSTNGSKIEPGDRFQNRTGKSETVPKSNRGLSSEIEPDNGSEFAPGTVPKSNQEGFQNRTDIKTTSINNSSKQQQQVVVSDAVAVGSLELRSYRMLIEEGFDEEAARSLASKYPLERIQEQIGALLLRKVSRNKLGMLRKAIEENWPIPESVRTSEQTSKEIEFVGCFYAALAGREGAPTVLPSRQESDQAEKFLEAIGRVLGRDLDPGALGRSFGGFVKRNQNQEKSAIRSLSLAVRSFGDGFFAKLEEDERKARRQAIEDARKAHQDRHTEAFNQYESSLLTVFAVENPELVKVFEEKNNQRLVRMKDMSPKFVEQMKTRLEDPTEKAKMFAEFLREEKKVEVLDFWKWDEQHNPTPFRFEREKSL